MKEMNLQEEALLQAAENFLRGYRLCADMLGLCRRERRRASVVEDDFSSPDILSGDETYWRAHMYEVEAILGRMRNGREKMLLYYRYIKGESVERAANTLGFSRRTGYRLLKRGIATVAALLRRK